MGATSVMETTSLLAVALGGALGALLRAQLGRLLLKLTRAVLFGLYHLRTGVLDPWNVGRRTERTAEEHASSWTGVHCQRVGVLLGQERSRKGRNKLRLPARRVPLPLVSRLGGCDGSL